MTHDEKRELENDVLYWSRRAREAEQQAAHWKAEALEAEQAVYLAELSASTRESVDEWGNE